jgi:hypothetical protein
LRALWGRDWARLAWMRMCFSEAEAGSYTLALQHIQEALESDCKHERTVY